MDEEFDAGLDMSSDMDLGSDFSSDTDAFGGGELADMPDDIGEDISSDFGDVSDFDAGVEEFPDSIDEDVLGDDSLDMADDIGTDMGMDTELDADSSDFDFSDVPEDVDGDLSVPEMEAADISGDIPDELVEDTDFIGEDASSDTGEFDSIPEDITGTDAGGDFEEEGSGDLEIPEDVDPSGGSDFSDDFDSSEVDEESWGESPDLTDGDEMQAVANDSADSPETGSEISSDTASELSDSSPSDSDDVSGELPNSEVQEDFNSSDVQDDTDMTDVQSEMPDASDESNDEAEIPMDGTDADIQETDISGDVDSLHGQGETITDTSGSEEASDDVSGSDAELTPMQELSSYMNDHNYGPGDFDEYSQDPEWQRLHEAAFPDWEGRPDIGDQPGDIVEPIVAEETASETPGVSDQEGVYTGDASDVADAQSTNGAEESPYTYHFPGYEEHEFPEVENPKVLKPDYGNPPGETTSDVAGYSDDSLTDEGGSEFAPLGTDTSSDGLDSQATSDLTPMQQLSNYMNEHNYGENDYAEYSQDPEWQRLHGAVFGDSPAEAVDASDDGVYHAVPGRHGDLTPEELGADDSPADLPVERAETADLGSGDRQDMSGDLISGQELLDRFGTGQHRNGSDYFVKGDHFDQFENDYYSPDESSYTEYDTPVQRDVSPGLIEGIHLGKGEVEDPSVFWGQHEKGGTAESFQEIASHIPEVRDRLAAGDTLDDLAGDEKLSDCASIYFRNMPEVIERDGYYEFNSNGRHRILAARALGHDIPVKVIGKRS